MKMQRQTCTMKNVTGHPFGRRKMSEANLDLHKGMKSTTNFKYMGKYMSIVLRT